MAGATEVGAADPQVGERPLAGEAGGVEGVVGVALDRDHEAAASAGEGRVRALETRATPSSGVRAAPGPRTSARSTR